MSNKIYVVDTSVIIHDPKFIDSFPNQKIILCITVIEELDRLKTLGNQAGKNARVAIKYLDKICDTGDITEGIILENGCVLEIDVDDYGIIGKDPKYGDNKILACCLGIKGKNKKSEIVFLSRDTNLRLRAKAFGISAQNYNVDNKTFDDLYKGYRIVENEEARMVLKDTGHIFANEYPELKDLCPNECILFKGNGDQVFGKAITKDEIKMFKEKSVWNLRARNIEQVFAMELLLDNSIPLITLVGNAGGGKSLLAVAAGLELVLNKNKYDNFIIYKPVEPMGSQNVGFLPGLLEDKLAPFFTNIDDSFSLLLSDKSRKKDNWKTKLHQYLTNGTISKESLNFIRGRSIPNSLILIDEVQNLSKEEIKTILTRVGVGSKVILTGDISQIDNTSLDAINNAITYTTEKFKGSHLAGHITLNKGERSELATAAVEIL